VNLENDEVLNKIIEVQSCIIQGKDLKVLLHKNREFYLEKTNADIIVICMNEQEKVHMEYVLERHRDFAHLAHKYIFDKQTISWDTFVSTHYDNLIKNKKYFETDDIYQLFKGLISKKSAEVFKKDLKIENAILMPVVDFDSKHTIGYIYYIYQHQEKIDIKNLKKMQQLFQTLLQPLYDKQYSIIYSKCVRVDENFSLLTSQEKRITKQVLKGKSYIDIADMLNISINTIKTHMKSIFNKYHVKTKIELYNKLNSPQK